MTSVPAPRRPFALSAALVAASLASTLLFASDKYTVSETAVFPDGRPDRALLYVVRNEGPRLIAAAFKVYAGEVPLGYLKPRSYLTAEIASGPQLLWGPDENEPRWVDLEAGKTYVLRIAEQWNIRSSYNGKTPTTTSVLESTTWQDAGTTPPRDMIQKLKLKYASITDAGRAALGEDAAKGFAKAGSRAVIRPEAQAAHAAQSAQTGGAPPLPRTFEKVWYRPQDLGAMATVFKSRKLSGSLAVTPDKVELVSGDEKVTIPVPAIRSVVSDFMPGDFENVWVIVQYAASSGIEIAGFSPSELTGDRRARLQSIADAIGAARSVTHLEPIDQVVRAVQSAEALETARSLQTSSFPGYLAARDEADKLREDLHKVDPILTAHLERAPTDLEALFLQVRLDRALAMLTPVVISGGVVEPGDALAPTRDPQATLDRILELSPGNARAFYMKARLYGVSAPPVPGSGSNLDQAIVFARRAVAADPGPMEYREALALYLISADKEAEALEVIGKGADARHPLRLLLTDRANIPFPQGAIVQPAMAMEMSEMLVSNNPGLDYPILRVLTRIVPGAVTEVEAFYKKRWPDIRFRRVEDDEPDLTSFETELEWRGESLTPTGGAFSKRKKPAENSVALLVMEASELSAEIRQHYGLPASGGVCQLVVYNFRTVANPVP